MPVSLEDLLAQLRDCPLIASAQADAGTAADDPECLSRLAKASVDQGVQVLRMQGVANIMAARDATRQPVIGLIKRDYPGSPVYITPTEREVDEALHAGSDIVALDGTDRPRPAGASLARLIERIHLAGALALADVDSAESARYAVAAGADLVSTTLGGYTDRRSQTNGPDLELLREVLANVSVPVLAEGRFEQRWHVEAALRIGAAGVVVGGALNDPVKNTRRLMPTANPRGLVGAVDIGGTWLRFGVYNAGMELQEVHRTPNPPQRKDRIAWIQAHIQASGVDRVGVGTGGIVDPTSGEVWTAKEYLMPDHIGLVFDEATLGVPTYAFGDGHATAWGHACLSQFAGKRVATLALGTGVGCGFVQDGRIWCGRRGEYPRINDLPAPEGQTYEDLLGGMHLTKEPDPSQQIRAKQALIGAITAIRDLYFPDDLVVCGSVGLADWMRPTLEIAGVTPSPLGGDAGLFGAACLAAYPTWR
jgi:putative N-acetylmannosamine-6-phosphate epimerase